MKVKDLLSEAPLKDYEPLGNFEKTGGMRGDKDKQLLKDPEYKVKVEKFFKKTNYDYRLYPVNLPGISKYAESGVVSEETLREMFVKYPKVADTILGDVDDAITIVYVGNSGVGTVGMTPWNLAHRFGHVIEADNRKHRGRFHAWKEAESYWFDEINRILTDDYHVRNIKRKGFDHTNDDIYRALFTKIGTQRSSRENNIIRGYEFLYELFAQYLNSGAIKLNPFPRRLAYGKQSWGNSSSFLYADKELSDEDLDDYSNSLQNTMGYAFGDVESEAVGKIFVM